MCGKKKENKKGKLQNCKRFWGAIIFTLFFTVVLSTCSVPLGLGDPVDLTPPTLFIVTPENNQFLDGIIINAPIEMSGNWYDDTGIVSLSIELYDRTDKVLQGIKNVKYSINTDGTWTAGFAIDKDQDSDREYDVSVIAKDKFGNTGGNTVRVRIEIVPPWIESHEIIRHPNFTVSGDSSFKGFKENLYPKASYDKLDPDNISYENIDRFQNESFTLKVNIVEAFSGFATSRLIICDEKGEPIVYGDQGREPTRNANTKNPEWDITPAMMPSLGGAHFIQFRILAWSQNSWDDDNNMPKADAPYRKQMCMTSGADPVNAGTIWYNNSDKPKISLNAIDALGDIITLSPNRDNQLQLRFYDDDRINEIYAGLVTKAAFDTLRGSASEEEFLASLETSSSARTDAIAALNAAVSGSGANRFAGFDIINKGRIQEVGLGTGNEGEYRLIAFVKEYKPNNEGYSFVGTYPYPEKWTSYPLLRVQVQNMDIPLIFIENPDRENIIPTLTEGGGEGFIMKGYVLDSEGATSLQIAWAPTVEGQPAATEAQILQAINAVFPSGSGTQVPGISGGKITRVGNYDITVWNVTLNHNPVPIKLNNVNYFRSDFSQYFHIVDDFLRNGRTGVNALLTGTDPNLNNKNFTIIARKSGSNTARRTFRINGITAGPNVEVTSHGRGSNHDRDKDLDLRMRVSPGQGGVKIRDNSARIYDGTGTSGSNPPNAADNIIINNFNGYFDNVTLVSGSEYYRTISSNTIKSGKSPLPAFEEGSKRTYIFEAFNILGIRTFLERDIVMSNRPILESITCSNGDGTYGIGTVLRFEASFSMPVQVPDTYLAAARPALRLYTSATHNANPGVFRSASFVSASGNTAVFEYTVVENDMADKLFTETCTETASDTDKTRLILNHASIRSTTNENVVYIIDNDNSLQSNVNVGLKATRPTVVRAAFTQTTGNTTGISYYNNGKNITMKLYMSEQVTVSGTPRARISYGNQTTQILEADFVSMSPENVGTQTMYVLFFLHVLQQQNNIALSSLSLATQNFATFTGGADITDVYGNSIDTSKNLNTAAMIDGRATGNYTRQQASIKTTIPATPLFTLHTTLAGAQATNNTTNAFNGDKTRQSSNTAAPLFLRIDLRGESNTTGRYSLYGGNNSVEITGTPPGIFDANYANRFNETGTNAYVPSQYSITAWQVDIAGNSSEMAVTREVTIKSRWPELRNIDFGLPDGAYKRGQEIPIKINMSDVVVAGTGTQSVNVALAGISGTANGNITIMSLTATVSGSMITANWTVPATGAPTVNMKDIKLQSITFNNINDEYGNALRAYSGTTAESAGNANRPIGNANPPYTFQFARPNFEIVPNRPHITNSDKVPAVSTSGANINGYVLSGNSFTLDFDVNVTAVAGNNIVIRPYGNYAIPPVLSIDEFDSLKNADFRTFTADNITTGGTAVSAATRSTYLRRLTDVDANGIPVSGSERGNTNGYNMYTKNTHGLTTVVANGNVRPDTTTKMVLDFGTDLYTSTNAGNLRTVFTAARWKWQNISVTSSYVTIANNIVTVTLPETLDKGRIWEVIVPDGAFQDMAANASMPVNAGTFRFWSQETAAPVIRVERVSYDANNYGNTSHPNVGLGFVSAANAPQRPPVDTRVRIDCETPGAVIRYDLIRTDYRFANSIHTNGTVFSATDNTDTAFFGAAYTSGDAANTSGPGYTRNNIGNADVSLAANKDSEGFFSGLLVPRTVNTGTASLANGTFSMATLNTLGSNMIDNFSGTGPGHQYNTVTAAGANTFNFYTNNFAIYIGDAYSTTTTAPTNVTATGAGPATVDTDARSQLFTGRRDYIIAVAKKGDVNATNTPAANALAGPALNISAAGKEGVFKTNMLYRVPGNNGNAYRILVQGFDQPVIPVVAGFPLRDADSTNSNSDSYNNYFSKSAYRVGGGAFNTAPSNANYMWVSWEIVTDWYQKGKGYSSDTAGNYLNNDVNNKQHNANSIAAPYGGVIYRYDQDFYGL